MPGASSTSVVSASPAISTSLCPTPTVSIRITSQPAASSTRSACGVRPREPAEVAARGHRADVDVAVEGVVLHPHPVAEQRAAGERRGRVHREDADALAGRAQLADQRRGRRRLADPGRAGDADDLGVAGVRRERGHHLAQQRRLVLDQRDQPRHRPRVTVAGTGDQVGTDAALPRRPPQVRQQTTQAGRGRSGRRPGRRHRTARRRRRRHRGAGAPARGAARSGCRTCRPGDRARSRRR